MHHSRRRALAISALAISTFVSSRALACKDHSSELCLCPDASSPNHTHDESQPLARGAGLGSQAQQTVWVYNFDYSVNQSSGPIVDATINVGDSIRWEWENAGFHSVTSVTGSSQSFSSAVLFNPGSTFFHTFTQPGVYTYYCVRHGFDNGDGTADGMVGTITVTEQVVNASWNVDFDGSWNTASNWTGNQIPNGAGHSATFGPNISGPRGVLVDSPVTVGSLNFQTTSPRFYNLAGSSTISLAQSGGGNAMVRVLSGLQSVGAKLQPVSDTTFQIDAGARLTATQLQTTNANLTKTGAGSLVVNRVVTPGSLTISEGTVRTLTGTSRVGALSINTSPSNLGTLDLLDQDLIVQNGSYATITGLIAAARNGGAWDKPGITAAAAPFATPKNTTLGTLTGAQLLGLGVTTFGGFDVAASDVLVKYTYYGDTDLNGQVNFDDYARIDNGFNNGGNEWFEGDFDYNGVVNFDDYSLIDQAFNTQTGVLTAVPEPTGAIAFAGLIALAASARRRKAQ